MNADSIILIDDADYVHPWKHTFIVPDAREDGFIHRALHRAANLVDAISDGVIFRRPGDGNARGDQHLAARCAG